MSCMIYVGDVLEKLKLIESESVQCCITSPPYWGLRDYGHDGQIGLEKTPDLYVEKMVAVFEEVKRVLRKDGTLWLNIGDSYAGSQQSGGTNSLSGNGKTQPHVNRAKDRSTNKWSYSSARAGDGLKPKDLCMIPARVALALQANGWWLRSDIIWAKPNPMPESVTDRPTKSYEHIFLMTKSATYYYDAEAIKEDAKTEPHSPGWVQTVSMRNDRSKDNESNFREWAMDGMKNKRDVWNINTNSYSGAHFATFPEEIPTLCIKAGTKKGDTVLDPFMGSGTTGEVALRLERNFIGIELNEKYVRELATPRMSGINPLFMQEVKVL